MLYQCIVQIWMRIRLEFGFRNVKFTLNSFSQSCSYCLTVYISMRNWVSYKDWALSGGYVIGWIQIGMRISLKSWAQDHWICNWLEGLSGWAQLDVGIEDQNVVSAWVGGLVEIYTGIFYYFTIILEKEKKKLRGTQILGLRVDTYG